MMKGYSAEEARAAAVREKRPPAATRPPLAATAYAATRDKVRYTWSFEPTRQTFPHSHSNAVSAFALRLSVL